MSSLVSNLRLPLDQKTAALKELTAIREAQRAAIDLNVRGEWGQGRLKHQVDLGTEFTGYGSKLSRGLLVIDIGFTVAGAVEKEVAAGQRLGREPHQIALRSVVRAIVTGLGSAGGQAGGAALGTVAGAPVVGTYVLGVTGGVAGGEAADWLFISIFGE